MPSRRSFLMRHVKNVPPDQAAQARYLLYWHTGELYRAPASFPRLTSPGLFGNAAPLSVEIGCGTGEFIYHLAASCPGENFAGIDTNLKSLYVATHQAADAGLDNIRFIKASAQYLYPLLVPASLRAVYVHFPEPIMRPKFRKRRLFNPPFFEEIARALEPGGLLSIVTDSQELLATLLPMVDAQHALRRTHEEPYLLGYEPEVKSRYQQYWEAHGAAVYRLELRRAPDDL